MAMYSLFDLAAEEQGLLDPEDVQPLPERPAQKYEQYRVSEHDLVEQFLRAMLPATPDSWRAKYRDQEPTLHRLIAETVERALPAGVRPDTAASLRALGDRWLAKYGPDMIERVVTPYLVDADAETTAALVAASWERVVQPMVRRLLSFGGLVAAAHRAIKFDPNRARDETGKWTKGGGAAPGKTNEGTPPGRRKYFPSEAGSSTSPHVPQGQNTMEAQGQMALPKVAETMTERPPPPPEQRAAERHAIRSALAQSYRVGTLDPESLEDMSSGTSVVLSGEIDGNKVIIKPESLGGANAEGQLRQGIAPGRDVGRELAAQEVNRALGDLVVLPVMTMRDDPDIELPSDVVNALEDNGTSLDSYELGRSLVAEFREGETVGHPDNWNWVDEDTGVNRIALFDAVIGNLDRHQNNALISGGELVAIDHSLAFPHSNDTEWGNEQAIAFRIDQQGDALDDDEVARLQGMLDNHGKIFDSLEKHLTAPEIDAMFERVGWMVENRQLFRNVDRG